MQYPQCSNQQTKAVVYLWDTAVSHQALTTVLIRRLQWHCMSENISSLFASLGCDH